MKIKNLFITMIVILTGYSIMMAQARKIQFVEFDLKNGLHVILHQDNSTPVVAVTVMYHVGSKNERPDRTGFAHMFEHLMFEGTENIPRFEYDKYVNRAGGALNANTNQDRTFYYENLPSNQLEMGLWLESERMLHAKIDSIGIKTQKNVVIEEKKQSYDNRPYGSMMIEVMKRAYNKHPYRWTTIGDAAHLRAAKDADIIEFYKTFYVPDNAVLSIAGDIKIEDTKKMVEKYFADIPKSLKPIPRPVAYAEPELTKEIRDTIYDNVQLPQIVMAYRIPADGTSDYYALVLLGNVLTGGPSSRMVKAIVDEQQKAMTISCRPMGLEHPGINLIVAMPNAGVPPGDVETSIEKEIDKVKNELISDREFQKVKNQIENRSVSQNANFFSIAENLASNYTFFKNTDLINSEIDNYMKITKEDIKHVANKYLRKENRVVLYYMPKSSKK